MMKLLNSLACLSFMLLSLSAHAADVTIQNASSDNVKLYSNSGRGWTYEGTIRAGSRAQTFHTHVGDSWGFSDPHNSRIDIIKEITVRNWGSNSLVLTERDLGHGGPPPIIQRNITITNYSSKPVDVYSDHGHGWHSEGTVGGGTTAKFPVENGEEWGIDNPFQRGMNLVKQLSIKPYDPLPGMTITDRELGISQPIRPVPRPKTITAINRSSDDLKLYVDEGTGYKYVDTVRRGSQGVYEAKVGDNWTFDDPHIRGINPISRTLVKAWGSNILSVDDADFHHDEGGGAIPIPLPQPDVSITFKNQSINKGNVYRKTGPFSKTYLGTVGPWGAKTYTLSPGDNIVISKPGSIKTINYRVPEFSETFPFKSKG